MLLTLSLKWSHILQLLYTYLILLYLTLHCSDWEVTGLSNNNLYSVTGDKWLEFELMPTQGQNTQLQSINYITPNYLNNIENNLLIDLLFKMDLWNLIHWSDSYCVCVYFCFSSRLTRCFIFTDLQNHISLLSFCKTIYIQTSWVLIPVSVFLATNHIVLYWILSA